MTKKLYLPFLMAMVVALMTIAIKNGRYNFLVSLGIN